MGVFLGFLGGFGELFWSFEGILGFFKDLVKDFCWWFYVGFFGGVVKWW